MQLKKGDVYRIQFPMSFKTYTFISAIDEADIILIDDILLMTQNGLAIGHVIERRNTDQETVCTGTIVGVVNRMEYYKIHNDFLEKQKQVKKLSSL